MSQTLLVGCSFLERLNYRLSEDEYHVNAKKYTVLASSGSGNQALAARTIYEVNQNKYDQVVVLWSGINRLDFPISEELNRTYPENKPGDWIARCHVGSMVWFHSGGILGLATSDTTAAPHEIKNFFQTQYLGTESGSKYLSELSLMSILSTQAVLDKQKISYQMGFIYDTQRSMPGEPEEHSHGIMYKDTPLYNAVDWTKFTRFESPYEWAKRTSRLAQDGYHPTRNAMIDWFNLAMNIDLRS
jgi:hypothetical protein